MCCVIWIIDVCLGGGDFTYNTTYLTQHTQLIQHAIYNIHISSYTQQSAHADPLMYCSAQRAARSTQHATRTQHARTQHATRNTQHATRNTQHATRNTQHAARTHGSLLFILQILVSKVKSVKLHIPSPRKDLPTGSPLLHCYSFSPLPLLLLLPFPLSPSPSRLLLVFFSSIYSFNIILVRIWVYSSKFCF